MHRVLGAASAAGATRYRVDDLIVDIGRRRVTRGDSEIQLPPLSFDLLLALVRSAPNMVSYDELLAQIWPGVVVNTETVGQRVKLVRDALGDDPHDPRYIAGVRGRGYRLTCSVEALSAFPAAPAHDVATSATTWPATTSQNSRPAAESGELAAAARHPTAWRAKRAWFIAAGVGALGVAAILVGANALWERAPTSVTVRPPPSRTLAVLPFENLSGNAADQYFGDALTEELINRVAQIPELRVTARTSAFAYRDTGEDVRAIAGRLGVANVLEGSVRRSGDRVRVTAQLIDARDGYHLWSDVYDREMTDIFAIQDEIASRIAQVVGIQVGETAPRQPTLNLAAYEQYLRGRTTLAQRGGEPYIRRAISHFEQAVVLDPNFAHPLAGLAAAMNLIPAYTDEPERPIRERAAALAHKALALDPRVPDAHVVIGVVHTMRRDFLAAEVSFRKAVEMHPNDAGAHYAYGDFLQTMGRLKEGYSRLLHARRLDPALSPLNWGIGMLEIELGYLDEAEKTMKIVTQLGAKSAPGLRGYLALRRGDFARARKEYDEYARVFGIPSFADDMFTRFAPGPKPAAFVRKVRAGCEQPSEDSIPCWDGLVAIADYPAAFAAARKGFAELSWTTDELWHPGVAAARAQPGFKDLVRDLGLVTYWRKYGWPDYCKPLGEDFECE